MTQVKGRISRLEKLIKKRGSTVEHAWWDLAGVCNVGFNSLNCRTESGAFERGLESLIAEGGEGTHEEVVLRIWDILQKHATTPLAPHAEMRWWLGEYGPVLGLPSDLATTLGLEVAR